MKHNRNAQAMVEFILILPIMILLLLGIIDIGRIIIEKSNLDNQVTDAITTWNHNSISDLKATLKQKNTEILTLKNEKTGYITVKVTKKVTLILPFLKNYNISVKRVVIDE